jgi:hypothetical protein
MKPPFTHVVLLVTLLTGSFTSALGDQAPPIDPRSSDSVERLALEWFECLQAGQIDRTQMTTELSAHLTDDAVMGMARHLKTYGPATGDEIVQIRTIQDQTFYVVKLFLERGDALSLLIGFDDKGRITGISFSSMGQE